MGKEQLPQTRDTIDLLLWCGLDRDDFKVTSPFDKRVQGYLDTYIRFTRRCTLDKQLDSVIPLSKHFRVTVYWYDGNFKRIDVAVEKPAGLVISILDDTADSIVKEDVYQFLVERYQQVVARKLQLINQKFNH